MAKGLFLDPAFSPTKVQGNLSILDKRVPTNSFILCDTGRKYYFSFSLERRSPRLKQRFFYSFLIGPLSANLRMD